MCDCERALELISLGLDGMLTGGERRELDGHLERCEACRSLARELREVHAAMDGLEEEVPEGFHAAVMGRVRAEKVVDFPAKRRKNVQRWASMAAVLAVILIGAGTLKGYLGGMAASTKSAAPEAMPQAAAEAGERSDAAAGVMPFAANGGETVETAPPAEVRMTPAPRMANSEALMGGELEKADEDVARTPTEEERETIAANCAAWVLANGYDRIDTGFMAVQPVTEADLEAAVCGGETQERLGMDDWRVTVGDAAGREYIGLICDGETLEVLGYILSF